MLRPNHTDLKRFFKSKFGLNVRAKAAKRPNHFANAWIPCRPTKRHTDPLVYDSEFPPELRNQCLRIIYPNSPGIHEQTSAGNVRPHDIAMHPSQWLALFALYGVTIEPEAEQPAPVLCEAIERS